MRRRLSGVLLSLRERKGPLAEREEYIDCGSAALGVAPDKLPGLEKRLTRARKNENTKKHDGNAAFLVFLSFRASVILFIGADTIRQPVLARILTSCVALLDCISVTYLCANSKYRRFPFVLQFASTPLIHRLSWLDLRLHRNRGG